MLHCLLIPTIWMTVRTRRKNSVVLCIPVVLAFFLAQNKSAYECSTHTRACILTPVARACSGVCAFRFAVRIWRLHRESHEGFDTNFHPSCVRHSPEHSNRSIIRSHSFSVRDLLKDHASAKHVLVMALRK